MKEITTDLCNVKVTHCCIARPPQPIPADLQGTAYTNDTMLMVTAELQDPHNIVVTIVWHRWPSLGLQEVKGKDCKVITTHLLYGHQLPRHQGATPSQPLITDELQGPAYTINSVEVIVAELQDTLCTVVVTSVVLLNLHLQKVKGEQHQTKRSPLFILSYHSMEVVTAC